MIDLMELQLQARARGYQVRMVEVRQISTKGYIRTFVIEGGGPHSNPAVSKYADFTHFEYSPEGCWAARAWLHTRGAFKCDHYGCAETELLQDVTPPGYPDGEVVYTCEEHFALIRRELWQDGYR